MAFFSEGGFVREPIFYGHDCTRSNFSFARQISQTTLVRRQRAGFLERMNGVNTPWRTSLGAAYSNARSLSDFPEIKGGLDFAAGLNRTAIFFCANISGGLQPGIKPVKTPIKTASNKPVVAPAPTHADASRRVRILLVDDDLYARELNAGVLIRAGYLVDTAEDGATAWKILNDGHYDLLITDNRMPRVTGMELIKKLRSEDMTVPIILASGTAPTEELARHPWLNLDATLSKPFTIADLLDTVKKVLAAADSPGTSHNLFRHCAMKDDKRSPVEAPAVPLQSGPMKSPQRILVVDDENDSRQLTVDVLSDSGYAVEAVKDGAAGWEALQESNYDLIITDNKMPRMKGIELIEKLRAACMALPVIMATSYLPTHEFVRRPWLKPDLTLEKPYSNDDLLEAVDKILGRDDGSGDQKESLLPKYL
jgi:two-component system, chemotaxis family, chemotaxis protein CheY